MAWMRKVLLTPAIYKRAKIMSRLADTLGKEISRPVPPFTLEVKWPGEDEEELTFQCMHTLTEEVAKLRKQSTYDNNVRLKAWDKVGNSIKI